MATNPNKIQDPTEAALTAIQEALEVQEKEAESAAKPMPEEPEPVTEIRRNGRNGVAPERNGLSQQDEDLFVEQLRPPARVEEPALRRPAANDDRQSIGQILQALQQRPSRMSYTLAAIFSAAWLVGGVGLAWMYLPQIEAMLAQSQATAPILIGLGALFILPVVFFFVLAHMVWRSQELRLIAQSMAQVAVRLAEPEQVARESIVSVGQAIRREVAAMGDGVERALARAAELEALVHNEVSALERAYNDNEVRIRGLLHDLSGQRDILVTQAEQVRNAITSVHLDLSHDISSVTDRVAERVTDTAQRITHSLSEKGEQITLALGRAGDSMITALSERGSDLLERLETTSEQTTQAINTANERMTASLNFKGDTIHEEFSNLAANLTKSVSTQMSDIARNFEQRSENAVTMMGQQTERMTASIVDTSAQVAETIAGRVEEVNSTLKATGDSLVLDLTLRGGDVVSNLETAGARINDALVNRSEQVSETFQKSSENFAQAIDTKSDAVKNMLSARQLAFEETFTHGGAELGEKIARESTTLGNLITRHLTDFDRTVKTYGGELVERLGERTEKVSDAMRNYVDSFDSRVNARIEDIGGMLERRVVRFTETLDERARALDESFDGRINDIGKTIDSRGAAVAETIRAKLGDIDTALGARALDVANNLDSRIGRIEELNNAIKTQAGDVERTLSELSANVSTSLKQNAEDVERTLTSVSADVGRSLTGKADEIAAAISQRAGEMSGVLDQGSSGLLAALTNKSEEFAAQVGRATDHALNEIESKGYAFTRTMTDQGAEIGRSINEASVNATVAVTRSLQELQDATSSAIEQSKQTATATVSEMMETHGMLRNDTTALFERLREANILLQEVLSGAHENMSSIENVLVTRVSEFVSTMNAVSEQSGTASSKVEEHIGRFNTVTSRVLGDLSQLATQFESHGRALSDAVEMIDRSNRQTEEALTERRAGLDSLVSTLDVRSQDLEQRLTRFTGLLDETLDAAGERARDIARIVSEASNSGTHAISEQFDRVRSTVEEERQRTAETLRGIYEDARSDTSAIFRQSTERFTEVIQGMKHMAAEMQNELEATRGELRRGILELPQETAESAAQMRRVIVEQIEALAELNRIVARHGRGLDATEPARRAAPRDEGNEPARRNAARDENILAGMSERMETPRQAPRRELPPVTMDTRPTQRRTEGPSANPAAGSGWLSDLLQRASRDEDGSSEREGSAAPERNPRHTIESLDSLSVDIARMIDHDAAAELWDKYKRGDRNIFTRRLYTLQGQKAFDDIRKRYRGDREFRQTVDRYISEFERLLEEVSRDDRGQVVARTYLTSETGKVYTMLAHAAGRFD